MRFLQYFTLLALVTSPFRLNAQLYTAAQDSLFWDNKTLYRVPFDGDVIVKSDASTPTKETSITVGFPFQDLQFRDNLFHFVGMTKRNSENGKRIVRYSAFESPDFKNKSEFAFLEVNTEKNDTRVSRIFSLGNKWFVLVASADQFRMDKQSSRIALGRSDSSGKIEITRLIKLGLPEGVDEGQIFPLVFSVMPICTDDGLYLFHQGLGFVWYFLHTQSGNLKTGLISIFPKVVDLLKSKTKFDQIILGAQPTNDGRLLIAARSNDGIVKGRVTADAFANAEGRKTPDPIFQTRKDEIDWMTHRLQQEGKSPERKFGDNISLKAFPEIIWYEISPTVLKLVKCDPPSAKVLFSSVDEIRRFAFIFRADGKLVFN